MKQETINAVEEVIESSPMNPSLPNGILAMEILHDVAKYVEGFPTWEIKRENNDFIVVYSIKKNKKQYISIERPSCNETWVRFGVNKNERVWAISCPAVGEKTPFKETKKFQEEIMNFVSWFDMLTYNL